MENKKPQIGLPGRLSKGAGTHLASWLQEVTNISREQANIWLEGPRHAKTAETLNKLQTLHGKNAGHSNKIIDADFSGELIATKDLKALRLWRARDGALLRIVSAVSGDSVAFSPAGQNIVTGTANTENVKVWGPAGGSAVGAGKTKITAGKT